MIQRRGTLIFRDGRLERACLTLTGARILAWRLRREQRDAARTERKMNRIGGLR